MNLKLNKAVENGVFWSEINALAKEAFPPEEYLAPTRLYEMSKDDDFDFLFVADEQTFVGFAVVQTYKDLAYLFFLAIDEKMRSKGYGGGTLRALKNAYPDKNFVVDFEMLDKTAENYPQREKRKPFYLRNGYKETGLYLNYLGVDYEVAYLGNDFDAEGFKTLMKRIKVRDFNPKYFTEDEKE